MLPFLIAAVLFAATFTQTVSGFGHGLIAMALLPGLIGLHDAVPLVALVGVLTELTVLGRYRHAFNLRAVVRLSVGSIIGIPVGILALELADERVVLPLLGVVITGYAVYALLKLGLPELANRRWAYGFGFIAGILSGLYNVGGPPVVIYGTMRRWSPAEFRSNLQGFFLVNSLIVTIAHFISRNYTDEVLQYTLFALPGIVLGLLAGFFADRYVNALVFRRIVFLLLIVLGARLILGG